jgi:hypothetical protein
MMSAPARVSSRACASGLPFSRTIRVAMSSARARRISAALRISLARSKAEVRRHTSKPRETASSAASRSARLAWATVPMRAAVAGSTTGIVRPSEAGRQTPSM